ncbi:MAG: ABC transporter substrate-binding protein [Verrucomicrobiota bacterium]
MNKRLYNFLWAAVMTSLLGFATTGCNKPGGLGDAAAPIKVGEFASLTGNEATFGNSSHEGTLLAIEEINTAGGVLGRQLALVTEDTRSRPGEPATVVNKLISRDGVVAVLGEVASSALPGSGPRLSGQPDSQ